jgi:putative tryptophan/tyrosine transport system substrate-binding protein
MAIHLRRREFIFTLGSAAAAWPFAAHAQQPAMPVIGILSGGSQQAGRFRLAAIQRGLNATGFVEGQNVAFEYRSAEGRYERLPQLAVELAGRRPAVIVAIGNTATVAAKAAITTIPIVFETSVDPVEHGLVASLARPGGNLTGVTILAANLIAKQFELLHEAVPKAAALGFLENPTNSNAGAIRKEAQAAAHAFGQKLVIAEAVVESDFDTAFSTLERQRVEALLIRSDFLFNDRPQQLAALAARHKLPAIHPLREFAMAGGLMSYGTSLTEALREVGVYAGRILKGETPADLPVQQSAKVELVINLKAATALGVTFPLWLLGRADEVIE